MANTLLQNLEAANFKDTNKELFSEVDLKEFNDLIKDEESFNALIEGFKRKDTIQEINKIDGIQETIKNYVETQKGLKDLASIFPGGYTVGMENQDLYEVCILGAILTGEESASPDYKKLAEAYYNNPIVTVVEENEKVSETPNIEGTYETASADLKTETQTKIETEVKIENGKKITEASVTISAGADQRTMNLVRAQEEHRKKIDELTAIKAKFTDTDNQAKIQAIVDELSKDNIESKITDKSSKKTDNEKQHGNRYLIAARMAEGFVEALNKLTLTPEPKLTLKIDRENCSIGEVNADVETDRFVNMNLSITVETSTEQQTNTQNQKDEPTNQGAGGENQGGENQTGENQTGGASEGEGEREDEEEIKIEGVHQGAGYGKKYDNNSIEISEESPETLQLKHDISDHFKFKGEDIDPGDIADIQTRSTDKNKHKVSIKGYTGFVVNYVGENIEIKEGTVKKGLLQFDIKAAQTVKVDRISKDRSKIKKNMEITFNATKSKEYINEKLKTNTTGDQGKFEVKNDADVTETSIKVEYTNAKALKTGADNKAIIDTFTLNLDDNYMISKGKDKSIPLERQKAQGDTEELNCIKPYKIDDETTKMTYYGKTSGGTKDPTIKIINNITQTIEDATTGNITKTPLFTELTNLTKQDKTLEEYTEKVLLAYDTPKTTSVEKTFENTATVGYNDNKYAIKATFDIPGKEALTLTLPITYVEGSAANNNTSSVKYSKKPQLSREDGKYNKITAEGVMINGIVYDIGVADQRQKNIPTIFFRHVEDKTLKNAKERTKEYKIESNIFGVKKMNDNVQGYTEVNAGFGNCEFGPLTVKEGKRSDPITYYKEVYVGQVKDGDMILLQGTKIGTMYFDQHGKFSHYNANETQMTFDKQTNKVDLAENTPIGVKDPLGQNGRNLLITQKMEGTTLKVNVMDPANTYTGIKTGEEFIQTQDPEKAKNIDKYFYTGAETKRMIGESRILIYEALKKISSDDINEKSDDLFNLVNEKDKKPNTVLGPDRKGVYSYKLIKGTTDGEYPAQYIYCKVSNKEISLCNADGEVLEQQKIFLEQNNDYYNLKLNDDKTQFSITGKEKEAQSKIPVLDISTDKDYKAYSGDLEQERHCGYRSAKGEDENSYQFMGNKYTSFEVKVKGEEFEGEDKISDINTFSLTNENEEGFGSYKDFFTTKNQKNLGIDEKTYKEVFTKVLQEKETNTDKLIRVKYKKGNNMYYIPMYLDISKKGEKTTFDMEPSKGWKDAITETEKRLDDLVKAYSIFLEQDITTAGKTKGDTIQGRYLVKPTMESINKYFKDPTQPIELTLQTNNKISGEYQKEQIMFDPKKESIDKKTITVNNIQYSLSLKPDNKFGYKIVVKKGEVSSE